MPKPTTDSLTRAVSAALRFNRFPDALHKLPGCPNVSLIMSSREVYRYKDAVELIARAEKMRNEAVADIVAELRGDWADADLAKAFND